MPRQIKSEDLAAKLKAGEPVFIVDVREAWEREIASLPDQLHVPLDELPARAAEIAPPKGAPVVLYCHAGVRSFQAAAFLEQRGLQEVYSLLGGIDDWAVFVDPRVPRY
jgi:rhodanese-related sulfurtransferase